MRKLACCKELVQSEDSGHRFCLGFVLYLGEVIHTLLEGVHNDIIELCQSF